MKKYIVLSEGTNEVPIAKGFDTLDDVEEYIHTLRDIERGVQAEAVGQDVAKLLFVRSVVDVMFKRYPERPLSDSGIEQPWRYFTVSPNPEALDIRCFRLDYDKRIVEVLYGEYIKNIEELPVGAAYVLAGTLNEGTYIEGF